MESVLRKPISWRRHGAYAVVRPLCEDGPRRGAWDWAILIEHALFFAIGFLAATLAAVAAAPLVSRRAMRLAVARARLRAPVTQKQAIADADALRARHAVEQARLERNLTLAEEVSAGLRVAVGRRAAEIIRLTSEIEDLKSELYDQSAKAETLARQQRDHRATIDASQLFLEDAFIQRDRASAARIAAEAHAADLDAEASRLRARIAVSDSQSRISRGTDGRSDGRGAGGPRQGRPNSRPADSRTR